MPAVVKSLMMNRLSSCVGYRFAHINNLPGYRDAQDTRVFFLQHSPYYFKKLRPTEKSIKSLERFVRFLLCDGYGHLCKILVGAKYTRSTIRYQIPAYTRSSHLNEILQ